MAATVESCTSLDVNFLNREGYLDECGVRGIGWTTDAGEQVVVARSVFDPSQDVLMLDIERAAQEGVLRGEIEIEYTECNFGGSRPWFSCPKCGDRVGTLHLPRGSSRLRCRDCHGLIYRSQEYKHPVVEALDRYGRACDRFEWGRESLEEIHERQKACAEAYNADLERLDEKYGDHHDYRFEEFGMAEPPGFDEWAEDLIAEGLEAAGAQRDYGRHGRCTALSKTTGGRCRQPARGDSGKCYYHGGAPGSGVGEEQTDHVSEEIRELLQEANADEAPPNSAHWKNALKLVREKAHVS